MKRKILGISTLAIAALATTGLVSCGSNKPGNNGGGSIVATNYVVKFNSNGGTSISDDVVASGSTIANLPTPTKAGHTFIGWFTENDEKFEATTAVTSDLVLTAKWQENKDDTPKTYTVSFDSKSGSNVTALTLNEGDTLPTALPTPAREGYTFSGWYVDELYTISAASVTAVKGNMTLFAKWTKNVVTYSVSFFSEKFNSVKSEFVESGKTISSLPEYDPGKGFVFDGWYTDLTYTNQFTTSTIITGNTAVYAKVSKSEVQEYDVYISNLNNDGELYGVDLNSSGLIDLSIPRLDGYTFAGLYTNASMTSRYNSATKLSAKTTLYAKWNKNNEYSAYGTKLDITSYIDSLMDKTPSYTPAWNKESFKGKWNYIDGVFLKSIVDLYKNTNDEKYKNFVHTYVNYYVNESGVFVDPRSGAKSFTSGELDSICESQVLFDLMEWYPSDTRYAKAIENTYSELGKISLCSNGINYNHKNGYKSQIWLDGMYMYGSFLARYANYKNDSTLLTELHDQYKYIYDNMQTPEGLYYHAMDTRVVDQTNPISGKVFWADSETGLSESVWGRSMGWLIVSLVDVIEYYPDGNEKTFLKKMTSESLETLLEYRDESSKMYYELVDQGNKSFYIGTDRAGNNYLSKLGNSLGSIETYVANYLESSCSSMFAYSMMKASKAGYVNSAYFQKGFETFEGTAQMYYNTSTKVLGGIHITAGLGGTSGDNDRLFRDGTPAYYLAEPVGEDDAKGVGPFIMAYLQYKFN